MKITLTRPIIELDPLVRPEALMILIHWRDEMALNAVAPINCLHEAGSKPVAAYHGVTANLFQFLPVGRPSDSLRFKIKSLLAVVKKPDAAQQFEIVEYAFALHFEAGKGHSLHVILDGAPYLSVPLPSFNPRAALTKK